MRYLLISIPKSGTHILTAAQRYVEHINMPWGSMLYESYPNERTVDEMRKLTRFGRTHVAYHPVYERVVV